MSLEENDQAAEAVAVAPRVSLDHIKSQIKYTYFINLYDAVDMAGSGRLKDDGTLDECLKNTTLCVIVMKNNFDFIGKSSCVSPENYNKELGQKIAYENAIEQIWSHEGYVLASNLNG